MNQIRLDKFISERTQYSRSQIKELVRKGNILLNGTPVKKPDIKINLTSDSVNVCGQEIIYREHTYVLLNKPEGYVCSTDPKDGTTVMELVPPELRTKDMFPAGRLDKDSLGAILLTDDGQLAHRILSPKNHIPKIYIVKLDIPFESKYIDVFKNGVILSSGEQCLPAKVKGIENCDKLAFVELHEGKYHQVKRMFAAVGNNVEVLMRVSVGGLILPEKLGKGQCMELLHKDVENLFTPLDFEDFCRNFAPVFSAIVINN
jgi:16S rRNA pseudouridine516 synthase